MIHKTLKKECDKLWALAVKARAGNKSEYSGKDGVLHAHHICGKNSYALRYSLENGVALTAGEHKFIAHRADRAETFRSFVLKHKGADFYEKMEMLKWTRTKTDLTLVKIYLIQEINND